MSQRGGGFKILEDEILCNAYVHHSSDSAIGTYQSKDDLWNKVETFYNEAVDVHGLQHRSGKSLSSRFDKIASSCTLFRAALTQVQARNQSGGNGDSMFEEAKELYIVKEKKNQAFKFDHAWKILKFHVKWAEPNEGNQSSSPLEGNTPTSIATSSSKRPEGNKKAKRKINTEKDPRWDQMMENTARSNALMEKQHNEFMRMEEKKLSIKSQKLKLETEKQELDIMSKDLSNLSPFSTKFWGSKQKAIRDRHNMPRAARNLHFTSGEGGSGGRAENVYVPQSLNNDDGGDDTVNDFQLEANVTESNYDDQEFVFGEGQQ